MRKLLLIIVLIFASGPVQGAVRAVLDRNPIMAGETTTLRIIFDEVRPQTIESFPAVPGLTISAQGQTQGITTVNGRTSMSITLTYTVSASKEGEYIIPAIKAVAGGQPYSTAPVKLTVTKSSAEAGNQLAFARLLVSKTNVYVGEVFPVEVQLYVTQAQGLQLPTLASSGFIIQKQAPYTQTTAQRGSILYNVLSFRSAVSAAKAGELELGPAEMSFDLLVRQQRNANDPFADFFGPSMRRQPMTVKTESIKMQVRPLPLTNVPPSFSGAVGTFAMNVDATPLTLTAGDPITLKLTISGRGNLNMVQMPKFNWAGFKFYEAQSTVNTHDPLGMEGSKVFEQVIIPESADVKEIPTVEFSFFDPARKVYRTLERSSMPLRVQPGAGTASVQARVNGGEEAAEEEAGVRDIVHIKPEAGAMLALSPPLIAKPWFLGLQAIPLAALLGAVAYRKRAEKLERNPRLRRRIETRKYVAQKFPELESLAAAQETDHFYALVFRMLQEQLGEKLNLPSSAITEAVLDQELPRHNATPEQIAELHHLFQECNQARYAPGGPGGHLQSLLPTVHKAIKELQSLPD